MKKEWQPRNKDLTDGIEFYTYEDLTVAYKYYNKNKNLPTILFFYGFGGNIEMLMGIAPKLAERYPVIVVDYPGHCYSFQPKKFDLKKYIDLVVDLVIKQGISDIYLVGYSFGGIASLLFYQKMKNSIKKLVLLHSDTNFSYNIFKKIFYFNFHLLLKLNFKFSLVYLAIPLLRDKYFTDELYKIAKEIVMYNNPKNVIDNYASIIYKNFDYLLSEVSVPCLVIGSKVDFLVSEKRSKYIQSKIKSSTLLIYEDIGHLSIVSRYEKVANDILSFVG
ncbi:MAG TPA: alpha/beta hydrolase [Spirochaetota bacterium]|nr:alpha/beta hydrolase [Spirochaetota bacterium]HOL58125.1 alpha/beta hydrolase [Spirochaetota bacterium]HPP05602.1 alpha/beta hydrolase [Spirochaetota bacterium]